MIVVDTNVIAPLFLPSPASALAEQVWQQDPDWQAPRLWLSEMRSVVWQYRRQKLVGADLALRVLAQARELIGPGGRHDPPDELILALAEQTGLAVYDCEFLAVAEALNATMVTWDKRLLAAAPAHALSPESFLA